MLIFLCLFIILNLKRLVLLASCMIFYPSVVAPGSTSSGIDGAVKGGLDGGVGGSGSDGVGSADGVGSDGVGLDGSDGLESSE